MEEFIAYLVKNLVSSPSEVRVTSREENNVLHLEIFVAKEDIGKVIGRKGNTINALRTIARTVATRLGRHVHIDLLQTDEEEVKAEVTEINADLIPAQEEASEEVEVSIS